MEKEYTVIKRGGVRVSFDVTKIRKVINWAVEGLDVNPLKLESNVSMSLRDGITTSEIQQMVILSALKLTSLEEPDWRIVSARLKLFDLYKNISIRRGWSKPYSSFYSGYVGFVKDAVAKGLYVTDVTDHYTDEELAHAETFITPEYDLGYDYAGANLLVNRYLIEYDDAIYELPQEMYLTISLVVEQNAPKELRMARVQDTYEKLAGRKISLATPFFMNSRRPGGNLSSCFITAMDDSRDSIYYTLDQIAEISKEGGGVGVNVSRIRSKGARIRGIKNASGGVVPWIRLINDTAVSVNQLGKRLGAVTVSLDVWHYDLEQFLELQTENGDQRQKAYDIFPQVVIPDEFMRRVETDSEWTLFDPSEVKRKYGKDIVQLWGKEFEDLYATLESDARQGKIEMFKIVRAKEIMKHIMKSHVETGMPYVAFKDTLNKYNPNKHDGTIISTNLCTESHSNVLPSYVKPRRLEDGKIVQESGGGLVHVCNLVSINVSAVFDDAELKSICETAVRILDNAIELTSVPVPEGTLHNQRYRTIGVGCLGLADHLAYKEIYYRDSSNYVDELFEKMAMYSIEASIDLAQERGTFEAYPGSDWDRGVILGHDQDWFKENAKQDWSNVFERMKKYGIRNSQILSIAPNTSTSLIQGCTAGVLPIFNKFYSYSQFKGTVPVCAMYVKDRMWYYQENKTLDQRIVVDVVSHINKWIDTGVSMELVHNLNMDINAKHIYNTIMDVWKKDVKTIYYTRTIQKDGSLSDKNECASCAS